MSKTSEMENRMATPRNAGPTGAGLIPPESGGSHAEGEGTEIDIDDVVDVDDGDQGDPAEVDIDAVPPPEDVHDDDEDDDDDDPQDIAEIERRVEARLQKRFDRAITKVTRRLESQYQQPDPVDDVDDEDDPPAPPQRRRQTPSTQRRSDAIALKSLARDRLNDEMASSGTAEKAAVKKVLDTVIPHLGLSGDDGEDVIDDLVTALAGTAGDLIKIGSDRKVRQLRTMGLIPESARQPAGGGSTRKVDAATSMRKGAAIARDRYPEGRRRR